MSDAERTTPAPSSATTNSDNVCPSWCVEPDCHRGDHWANPGGKAWPRVRATAWPKKGVPSLTAYPTWGQIDGLAPAVCLWVEGDDEWEIDESIDMTPDEAEALAVRLVAAALAARSVCSERRG